MEPKKVIIYNQNCTLAGRLVPDREIEEHGEYCGDWTIYSGTCTELLALADEKEQHARPGGNGTFDRRVAESLRTALSD